jgi:acetoin utilization deacetylase AcuC-like enzyme
MITVYSEKHLLRNPRTELYGGELVAPHECAQRAEFVLDRVKATGLGDIIAPSQFGLEPVVRVHDAEFVEFLRSA